MTMKHQLYQHLKYKYGRIGSPYETRRYCYERACKAIEQERIVNYALKNSTGRDAG